MRSLQNVLSLALTKAEPMCRGVPGPRGPVLASLAPGGLGALGSPGPSVASVPSSPAVRGGVPSSLNIQGGASRGPERRLGGCVAAVPARPCRSVVHVWGRCGCAVWRRVACMRDYTRARVQKRAPVWVEVCVVCATLCLYVRG